MFRELIEKSGLPAELKRAAFEQPWEELLVDARRTVKVTSKGRLETLHVTTAVGNMNGLMGIGMAAGSELQQVMLNSVVAAYRNVVPIPLYRAHTIYHPVDYQFRKLRIRMWPRPLGFGLTASPMLESLCGLAGLRNATIKLNGRRRNVDNVVKAFMHALSSQSLPHDGVEGSGVYVREVYHKAKLPFGLQRGADV
ncbi:MAG: hypothetical protein J3K34DRAFT_407089 [Monoraphidium minutum]|nr:MAG: hypothetical protein J3K34DRAFT_407089 [Monoraphidium minutum]